MLTLVVAASAGSDRVDVPSFFVNLIDCDDSCFCGPDAFVGGFAGSGATLPGADILSRATSVTAAALGPRGQDLRYQLCV